MSDKPRRRALVISRNLPPLTGGMERLNFHAYQALRNQFDMAICGPEGVGAFLAQGDRRVEIQCSPLSRFLATCQWQSWKLAGRLQPKLVYSGSGLTAPAALMAARSVGARSACFLHGLDIVADHPIYRRFFLPAIRRQDRILVNSHHTADLAESVGVKPDRIRVVHPGVDLPDLSIRAESRRDLRERFSLGDRPMLLAAGRLTERKGLEPFIRQSLPEIVRHYPGTSLVVIGGEASQALQHRPGIMEAIRKASRDTGLESQILILGGVTDEVLSQAYFAADLLVFPVRDLPGDIEGFGMVAVEAAAHGLQTVAFRVGGVPDAVEHGISGWLLKPGDYQEMAQTIVSALSQPGAPESMRQASIEKIYRHAERFRWEKFDRSFLEALALTENQDR